MRLAVYTDDPYVREDGTVHAVMPFALFVAEVGTHVEQLYLLGRVGDDAGRAGAAVALPAGVKMVATPWWTDLARPMGILRALPGSLRSFWRTLDQVDSVLLFGPSPIGLAFALLTRVRRRRLAIGVRMDYVQYIGNRRPGNRPLLLIARTLDAAWRLVGRGAPTIVVGAALAERYQRTPALLDATISLVRAADVARAARPFPGNDDGTVNLVTVGRVDTEKNPLLLADILAALQDGGGSWHLTVAGDGPLLEDLRARAELLGVGDRIDLRGFVAPGPGLDALYREADMFLHVSWTEGMPQAIVEAWAHALPVVATDVGGVRALAEDAAVLVGPGDAGAAAAAVRRVAAEPQLRERLIGDGLVLARETTIERQAERVATFLAHAGGGG